MIRSQILEHIALTLTLILVVTNLILSQDLVCNEPGSCEGGYYLTAVPAFSYVNCQEQCASTTDCNWFTFFELTGICNLHYNCSEIDTSVCQSCFTGTKHFISNNQNLNGTEIQ